ncbi:acyl-CoA dehydrogenase [Frateuria aurantia]
MPALLTVLAALIASGACAYHRSSLRTWAIATLVTTLVVGWLVGAHFSLWLLLVIELLIAIPLLMVDFRRSRISAPLMKAFAKATPTLSATEQVALDAGTVGFEGELFSGKPAWSKLLGQPRPLLNAEEQAFLDGPVEELGKLVNDWEITHQLADLPPVVWDFIKRNRFFGMIIPKNYGGLGFSALAHSAVLQKLSTMSPTLASTVAVPNSLGPAELLLHYGSEEVKSHYLPRLAVGEEIPCFALTGPTAGSDATSIPDTGVVCKQVVDGVETLGVSLTFDKRYITLAPIATLIGLAFRMYDPEHLLGDKEDIGITLALLPRSTPGLEIGRRHFPLNIPFQNGPVRGRNVFVPLTTLIGGVAMAGQGWRMLVECLSVGRAISLPSNATGAMRAAAVGTGAYARIRRQFGLPIAKFEGVEEALGRIAGLTYATAALSRATAAAVDRGERPAVPSAIAKYHATEWARIVAGDSMDVHGGKAVQLGPKNYAGRGWQGVPIAITVEGANIMTRNLMIFGQGAIRCHPYVLKEMAAVALEDPKARLRAFDDALFGHLGFGVSNAVRSFTLGLTCARIGESAGDAFSRDYYRQLNRYSAALALSADIAMGVLGGKLKFKERISARLGDVLSYLYIGSSILKRYEDTDRPAADRPLVAWSMQYVLYQIELALDGVIRNFPVRPVAWLLRGLVFPLGRRQTLPSDRVGHEAAELIVAPGEARDRLAEWVYLSPTTHNNLGRANALLTDVIAAEPVERKFAKALKSGQLRSHDAAAQIDEARQAGVLSEAEASLLQGVHQRVSEFVAVDDFDPSELGAAHIPDAARDDSKQAA